MSASAHSHEKHQPRDKALPCQLYNLEERSEDRHPNDGHEQPRLDLVGDPEPGGGLVEAVALFEDKGVVVAPREGGEGGEEGEEGDPEEGAGDLVQSTSQRGEKRWQGMPQQKRNMRRRT